MKDLDFDELDRAVNSVIGGNQGQADIVKEDTGASATASVSDATNTDVAPNTSVPSAAMPPLQPPAARRSTGRFMDVVHPSSDMRSNFVSPRPNAREGVTVQPSDTSTVEEPVLSSSPATDFVKSEWPDPIDYNKSYDQPKTEEAARPLVNEAPSSPVDDLVSVSADDTMPPLESPFIADAKVEKRPLGAFAESSPAQNDSIEEPAVEPDIDLSTNVTDTPNKDALMPAELQNNLLSIESNEDTAEVPVAEQTAGPEVAPTNVQAAVSEATPPVAITQQYVEQPSTGDKPAGSIFDVDNYHQPIAHPKKKKSGWLMIVWIVLLIIFGIAAGAAFYFYVLPKL